MLLAAERRSRADFPCLVEPTSVAHDAGGLALGLLGLRGESEHSPLTVDRSNQNNAAFSTASQLIITLPSLPVPIYPQNASVPEAIVSWQPSDRGDGQ